MEHYELWIKNAATWRRFPGLHKDTFAVRVTTVTFDNSILLILTPFVSIMSKLNNFWSTRLNRTV
jgi:hypothetical protein